MRHSVILDALFVTAFAGGCGVLSDDYLPTSAEIIGAHNSFLVAPEALTGHYGNMDVDAVVFSYKSGSPDADAFWNALESAVTAAKWEGTAAEDNERRYERLIPKTGERIFNSAEQARVSFNPSTNIVVVAWVQADSTEVLKRFDEASEAAFANRIVWPRFQELAHR